MQISNPELKKDERQNLKTKYKNQRLEEAKEIYLCECQKIYLSFPALYLHVKNKHKIKLTTKITDKICKMEEKNGKTYITYFLTNENSEDGKQEGEIHSEEGKRSSKNEGARTSHIDDYEKAMFNTEYFCMNGPTYVEENANKIGDLKVKSVIEQFVKEVMCRNLPMYQNVCRLMTHFLNYIDRCSQNSKQFEILKSLQPDSLLDSLPLYFNEFFCYYMPKFCGWEMQSYMEKHIHVQILKFFGNWLAQKNYTNYMTLIAM